MLQVGLVCVLSVCMELARMRNLFEKTGGTRATTWLGAFGAASPKNIQLLSNSSAVTRLKEPKPRFPLKPLAVESGGGFSANIGMAGSENYPSNFSEAYIVRCVLPKYL